MGRFYIIVLILFSLWSCNDIPEPPKDRELTQEFEDYWFDNKAEITSYKLEQSRYGEMREGTVVKIYVKEDFLRDELVKANEASDRSFPVLKLNSSKNFITGIYPYSIMESTYYPLHKKGHATKVTATIQEWCGQQFIQLINKKNFEINAHSYFAGEADQMYNRPKTNLENEIWNIIRLNPDDLPLGEIEMVPSFELLKLKHLPVKELKAKAEQKTEGSLSLYQIEYPEINRTLKIFYQNKFPYYIEKWEDSYPENLEMSGEMQTTKATKIKRLKSDYWNKNHNKDLYLREKLGLQDDDV